jgi:ArsR family transcriptional regulator
MNGSDAIFHDLSALADSTRGRLLLALEGQELAVSELCTVLQAPQSTVSRHLKVLADAGWVGFRPEGTSRLYQLDAGRLQDGRLRLWQAIRSELAALPEAAQDAQRLETVLI